MAIEAFRNYLRQTIPALTSEETDRISSLATTRKLRRKQLLLHEGQVAFKIFVVSGLLRFYRLAEDGNEYILKFTPELEWTTDPDSFYNQTPAQYNIDALEPSEVIMWSRNDFEKLRATIPALNVYAERVITQSSSVMQKRILLNISVSAEKRYLDFISSYSNIVARVPLHMIASYLGVSRETLTRIRQGLAVAK